MSSRQRNGAVWLSNIRYIMVLSRRRVRVRSPLPVACLLVGAGLLLSACGSAAQSPANAPKAATADSSASRDAGGPARTPEPEPTPVSTNLAGDTNWPAGTQLISGDLVVPAGVTLTIQPGAEVRFA